MSERMIHTTGWFEEDTDIYKIKLTVRHEPDEGAACKKGVIFSITEEQLRYLAEAQPYPEMRPGGLAIVEDGN